jgi:hypothetical protein
VIVERLDERVSRTTLLGNDLDEDLLVSVYAVEVDPCTHSAV